MWLMARHTQQYVMQAKCDIQYKGRWSVYSSVSQLFLVRGTLSNLYRYLVAPLDGKTGIKINKLQQLVGPLAPDQGNLMYRGTLVGNRWSFPYFEVITKL